MKLNCRAYFGGYVQSLERVLKAPKSVPWQILECPPHACQAVTQPVFVQPAV